MSIAKTFDVTFLECNHYRIRLTAVSEDEALSKAESLYCEENMSLFELDTSIGGTDEWQAEEVGS